MKHINAGVNADKITILWVENGRKWLNMPSTV